MEKLGDGNAIYVRGAGANNVVRRNYVHHLVAPMHMQCAIRTDGGQTDTLITENLIYRCTSQGIMLKLNNRCENNIVVDIIAPPRGNYLALREGPMTGATNERNIYYSVSETCTFVDELFPNNTTRSEDGRGRALARVQEVNSDHNIYFCKADHSLAEAALEELRRKGVDANSLAADPLFVDPENGDFRFKPDSPALKLGIVQIDLSKVGLRE